jgi:hypothetical protein
MASYHAFVHRKTGRRFDPGFERITSYHELADLGLPDGAVFIFPLGDQSKMFKRLDSDDAYKKLVVTRA